jgi:alkanesulfonate monooxygenase
LDDDIGRQIRERALDAKTYGVSIQAKNREQADDEGFIEPGMWTGIGRARSGCGAALVGSVDQVMGKIKRYQKMGIRAFIFSGYPHLNECEIFGQKVLPHLKTCSLPEVYGRIPRQTPSTPLGEGLRR